MMGLIALAIAAANPGAPMAFTRRSQLREMCIPKVRGEFSKTNPDWCVGFIIGTVDSYLSIRSLIIGLPPCLGPTVTKLDIVEQVFDRLEKPPVKSAEDGSAAAMIFDTFVTLYPQCLGAKR